MAGKEKYYCNSLILATGGFSHPELGVTGDGFTWLKSLGHKVKEAREKEIFNCPRGENGCFACEPYEAILRGEAKYVGIGRYGQNIYFL